MMDESRDVCGHPMYAVYSDGRVFSKKTNKFLKPGKAAGYPLVVLCDNGIATPKYVHHLVLEAFVSPMPDGMEARHLNDIKTDNRLSNLAWGTSSENKNDLLRNGRGNRGSRHGMSKLNESVVMQIRKMLGHKPQRAIGIQFGVSQSAISSIKVGIRWQWLSETDGTRATTGSLT